MLRSYLTINNLVLCLSYLFASAPFLSLTPAFFLFAGGLCRCPTSACTENVSGRNKLSHFGHDS